MTATLFLVVALGYAASCAGVVAGYTPFLGVFEGFYWGLAFKDLPVFKAAAANVASIAVVLFGAFWSSRGDRATYNNAVFGYSFFLPYFVVLLFLPGEQSKPDWSTLNWGFAVAVFIVVQFAAARVLRDWFWRRGGRGDA